jgi:hypothetical protein
MGFNKRYVRLDSILNIYKERSIEGLHSYFSADALIGGDDCSEIISLYFNNDIEGLKSKLDQIIKDRQED